jgi:Rieske 2Fe-2S family protein
MGGRMDLSAGVESMSMDGRRACALLPGLDATRQRQVFYYAIFPNLLISAHPDYVMVHTLRPLAHDRTQLICDFLFQPSELARPDFSAASILDFWDMTNRQDWHVCELAQQGIRSRGYSPGPYSNREDLLYAFDRFIVDTLG